MYAIIEKTKDAYWGERAIEAEKNAEWLSKQESANFLQQCLTTS